MTKSSPNFHFPSTSLFATALLAAFGSPYQSRPNGSAIGNEIGAAVIFAGADFIKCTI